MSSIQPISNDDNTTDIESNSIQHPLLSSNNNNSTTTTTTNNNNQPTNIHSLRETISAHLIRPPHVQINDIPRISRQASSELIGAVFSGGGLNGMPSAVVIRSRLETLEGVEDYWTCCLAPLLLVMGLTYILATVSEFAFAVQAIIIGSYLYDSETQDCQYQVRIWLLVFGSLSLSGIVLRNCCKMSREKNYADGRISMVQVRSPLSFLGEIASLVNFGWFIYGVILVYNKPLETSTNHCNDTQWNIFAFMIKFLLWCNLIIVGGLLLFIPPVCGLFLHKPPPPARTGITPPLTQNSTPVVAVMNGNNNNNNHTSISISTSMGSGSGSGDENTIMNTQ
jgi:hypothetical protein